MTPQEKHEHQRERKQTFGLGLLKGLGVTLKHLFKHNTVIQYPDEKQDLAPRTRGVIALKEENCTVCMLCGRECPDWCIYIDSHKETLPPKREGGRPRKRNVLDRFAIDYALCMYCGICVEVCPYDALFWSREFEYAEYDIRELTHEKERLSDWMSTVLPPPELEEGAEIAGMPAAPAVATPSASAATVTPSAPGRPARSDTDRSSPTATPPSDSGSSIAAASTPTAPAEAKPADQASDSGSSAAAGSTPAPSPTPPATSPTHAPAPVSTAPAEPAEDPEVVFERVLKEQLDKGSSPQVAQARAKVARVKAQRGVRTQTQTAPAPAPTPSAPTEGRPSEPEPSGAPEAEEPKPEQGPVAPESPGEREGRMDDAAAGIRERMLRLEGSGAPGAEEPTAEQGPVAPEAPTAEASDEDPEAVYQRVLREERDKGSAEAVAMARAKAARVRAQKGTKGPGGPA